MSDENPLRAVDPRLIELPDCALTVRGIEQAVLSWKPVRRKVQAGSYGQWYALPIVHTAMVGENQRPVGSPCVNIQAHVEPSMLDEIKCHLMWDVFYIRRQLLDYMENYRPVCIGLDVEILATPLGEHGAYR